MRSIESDATNEPLGDTPVQRSLTATLDRVDRLVEEALGAVVVPEDARRRARASAVEMLAGAVDADRAVPALALAYTADTIETVAVDLAARARETETERLWEQLASVVGVGRAALAREVLRAPLFSALHAEVALEVQLSLLVGVTGARAVSLWSTGPDGILRERVSAGEPDASGAAATEARGLAAALRHDAAPGTNDTATGVRLGEGPESAALIAVGAPPVPDHWQSVLRATAPALAAVLERDEAPRFDGAPERAVIPAVERRLARLRYDLHDGPQQDVHLLATDLALFREQLLPIVRADPNYDRIVGRLDDLAAELVALDGDLRRLASSVQSPFLPLGSLPESLRELAAAFAARTGIVPETQLEGDFSLLTESQQITLLALVREALSNVREHAGASRVRIAVSASATGASAEIVDDGRGFEPEPTLVRSARDGHLGLVGMHERVRMLGGRTRIESRIGGPTVISAQLPAWTAEPQT